MDTEDDNVVLVVTEDCSLTMRHRCLARRLNTRTHHLPLRAHTTPNIEGIGRRRNHIHEQGKASIRDRGNSSYGRESSSLLVPGILPQ